MTSLWKWFDESEAAFRKAKDTPRLEMARIRLTFQGLVESDPQALVRNCQSGRDLARLLGEPWWVFFYEVWMAIGHETHTRDLHAGLAQALYCVHEACKPALLTHPWRLAAFNTLLSCYVQIDPLGDADAIRACVAQLDREIPPEPNEHRYVMLSNHAAFLRCCEELAQAEQVSLKQLALIESDPRHNEFYLITPLLDLCWTYHQQDDSEKLLANALKVEQIAERKDKHLSLALALVWQAVAARERQDENAARRLFRTALSHAERVKKEPSSGYYGAVALFHERGGDFDKALVARDRQIAGLIGKGRYHSECNALIKRCDLLAKMGLLTSADIAAAKTSTAPLKKAASYLERIEALAAKINV